MKASATIYYKLGISKTIAIKKLKSFRIDFIEKGMHIYFKETSIRIDGISFDVEKNIYNLFENCDYIAYGKKGKKDAIGAITSILETGEWTFASNDDSHCFKEVKLYWGLEECHD